MPVRVGRWSGGSLRRETDNLDVGLGGGAMKCSACGFEINGEPIDYRGDHVTHREHVRCVELLKIELEKAKQVVCSYCGYKTPNPTLDLSVVQSALLAHIMECPNRPEGKLIEMALKQAEALDAARDTLSAFLSDDGLMRATLNVIQATIEETKEIANRKVAR